MHGFVVAFVVLILAASSAQSSEEGRVGIHVIARSQQTLEKSEKKALEKQMKGERKLAEKARKDLKKTLEREHGKKHDKWPDEARNQYENALQAEEMALVAYHEVKVKQKEILDSHADIMKQLRKRLEKEPRVFLVEAADQADVTVEVLARGVQTGWPALTNLLYLKVTPAEGLDVSRLEDAPFGHQKTSKGWVPTGQFVDFEDSVKTFHPYTEAEPYWVIQVANQGGLWGNAAISASKTLVAFCTGLLEMSEAPEP